MMKKFILIIVLLTTSQITKAQTQNPNWITPGQVYLKMYIVNDGVYRIDKNDFVNAGISTNTIDPRTVKVYYKGNQIPIFFYGESDGVIHDTDYFDFWGQRNYGGTTPAYDVNNNVFYTTDEYYDLYSDTSCYWIGWGGSYGLRFTSNDYSVTTPYSLDYYYKRIHFEQDVLYSLGETLDPDSDYRYFYNDKFQGEGWYWRTMTYNAIQSNTFKTSFLPLSSVNCRLKLFAYPVNYSSSVQDEHRFRISINNILLDTLKRNDFNRFDTTIYFPSSILNQTSNTLAIKSTPPTTYTSSQVNLDMVDIFFSSRFQFDSNIVIFKSEFTDSNSRLYNIKGFASMNEVKIYDLTNNQKVNNYYFSNDTLYFSGKGNGSFAIINKAITQKPYRIKQRSVPNLVTNSIGVDYLLIYNKFFESQAEQLRAYRQSHDGFRSFKCEIEDIYDIYNYGMESPVALRNFTIQVWNNWTLPKVKYLCLFGRGSLDPKKILASSIYYNNFIPVYGNPPSDGYFADMRPGSFTYSQDISVGRLPVISSTEAQDVISKIMGYESQNIDEWVKKPIFISGGFDSIEQAIFRQQSESLINGFIINPPISSFTQRIYLTDPTGLIRYNYQDSIIKTINNGGLICNFIGHAGNEYWDFNFTDPIVLNNGIRNPLVLSMTCFTGKNSESDFRGYGEKFTTLANNGSIGFIGSTGWGFTGSGQTYNEHILRSISIDTIRRIGEILKKASIRMAPDSISSFAVRNTINCFNLLGDPASKLILPVYPDFKITNNDYIVTNKYPNLNESINISFFAKNLGLNADSCKIRFQLLKNGTVNKTKDTVVRNFSFIDTLIYPIKIDTLGSYSAKIMIDVDNWYPQEDPSNNSIIVPITLKNSSLISLKPFDKQVIQSDSVEFVCLNPQTNPLTNNVKIIVQFDTSINFNSGLNQTFFSTSYVSVVSKFKKRIPLLDTNVKYYWRTNVIINNDSVGWSDKKTFSYGIVQKAENNKILNDSNVLLKKDKSTQYFTGEFNRTILNDNNVNIGNFTGTVRPSSFGENVWDPSYFNLNDTSFHILDRTGFIFYKLRKTDAKILDKTHFYFTSTSSPDSLINYLNNFDTTMILVGLKLGVPAGVTTNLTVAARNKIKEFGSTFADNLNSNDWSRWSIVCYKKIPNPIYSEAYVISGWSPAECTLSPDFQRIYGTVAHTFGPAQNWKNFTWEQILFPKSNIKFDVYGINKSNQEILLYSDIANTSGVPLDTVNAYTYPYMKFVTKMSIDTSQTLEPQGLYNGLPSPIFKSISLNITPPSELVIDYNSVVKSDSIIKAGDSVGVSLKYYNVGYKNCYGTVRSLYFYRGIDKVVIFQDTNFSTLKIDSSLSIKKYFTITNEMYPVRRNNEVVQLTFEISPLGQQNDYYDFNNKIPINIVLLSNNVIGNFDIYADGLKLMGGEYVKPQPELTFKYTAKEPNTILLSDSNLFQININNKYFTISNTSKSKIDNSNKRANNNEKSSTDINKKTLQTLQSVTIYPILENGINLIKIFYRSDVFSPFDTIKYSVNVTNELGALDINNYPNPFKDNTVFLFTVTGNRVFDCKIKIFTVAGRLIKTITAPVNIGYNQIYWDGKDDDGDALANGVYFYKLTIEGDTKFISDVQKLVVLK